MAKKPSKGEPAEAGTRPLTDPLDIVGDPAAGDPGPGNPAEDFDWGADIPPDLLGGPGDLEGLGPPPPRDPETGPKRPRSPVIGTTAFLTVEIPLAAIDVLQAWLLDTNHDYLPNPDGGDPIPYKARLRQLEDQGEAFVEMLLDVLGRDLDADADRPLTERHYNTGAWLGETFRTALVRYQQERTQEAVTRALEDFKHHLLTRAQTLLPGIPEDQLRYLFDALP